MVQISGGVFLSLGPQIGAISSFLFNFYICDTISFFFIKIEGFYGRPEVMDRAVLRPGRFGKLLYVPLPSPHERGLILKALARKKPIDASVDLIALGQKEACNNLSGADLSALVGSLLLGSLALGLNLHFFLSLSLSTFCVCVCMFRCLWGVGRFCFLFGFNMIGFYLIC